MKLLPATSFDATTAIGMAIFRRIAQDPLTGAYLQGSYGRRKTGRPRRYFVIIPTCNMVPMSNGKPYHESQRIRLTAYSDVDAIEKANAKLAERAG